MNDQLEAALALKFAPEWRFHHEVSGDGSEQNRNEIIYPTSIEQWHADVVAQTGEYPVVEFGHIENPGTDTAYFDVEFEEPLINIGSLNNMTAPYEDDYEMRLNNYPSGMNGDPDQFPTYYRCSWEDDGGLMICYTLFYPYDEKASPFNLGDHRGDWAGINVRIAGIDESDLNNPSAVANAGVQRVYYGGHGNKRFIYPDSPDYTHRGDHPVVYVARGGHTCFPRSGEWHNFDVAWWGDWTPFDSFDDMFLGNGLVVESWSNGRELINLGEENWALTGWMDYPGQWGPDGLPGGNSSSPRNPYTKEEWNGVGGFWWESLLIENNSYNDDFEPVGISLSAGWREVESPVALFWNAPYWDEPLQFMSGPQEYPNMSLTGLTSEVNSILLVVPIRVRLYTGLNFTGSQTLVTRSKPTILFEYLSMKVELDDGSYSCDEVVDINASGSENGSWIDPYDSVEEGVDDVVVGGTICISPGHYPENILIEKVLTLRAYGGIVRVGAP